jgi:hypothetical protein
VVLALGAEQDVGEHGHRALAIGDALRPAQSAKELDLEIQVRLVLPRGKRILRGRKSRSYE